MPGTNAGTGQPLTFKCAKCKRTHITHANGDWSARRGRPVPTGRTRPYKGGSGGRRVAQRYYEYRCLDCGHVGWSRHVQMEDAYRREFGEAEKGTVR